MPIWFIDTFMLNANYSSSRAARTLAAVTAVIFLNMLLLCSAENLVPLPIKLPAAAFVGTPTDAPEGTKVEKQNGPRPPFMAPEGAINVALHKKVTTSDANVLAENLVKITDGEKEATDEGVVQLHKGVQWVQIDLGSSQELFAIVVWHAHDIQKVFYGVVAQVSDDPEFKKDVVTLFNNDTENVDGLGAGTNRQYFETNEGKLIDAKKAKARYVRLYSKGSTAMRLNEYTEVEVYGRPAK
jgi:hypothetical protein